MGLFDFLTGSKSPAAGVARQPAETLRTALLALSARPGRFAQTLRTPVTGAA